LGLLPAGLFHKEGAVWVFPQAHLSGSGAADAKALLERARLELEIRAAGDKS
jgi:hypothetical protein